MRCFFLDIPPANRQCFDTEALFFPLFFENRALSFNDLKEQGPWRGQRGKGEGDHWRMSGKHFSSSLRARREEAVESSWAERVPQVPRRHTLPLEQVKIRYVSIIKTGIRKWIWVLEMILLIKKGQSSQVIRQGQRLLLPLGFSVVIHSYDYSAHGLMVIAVLDQLCTAEDLFKLERMINQKVSFLSGSEWPWGPCWKTFYPAEILLTKGENDRQKHKREQKTHKGVFITMFLSSVEFDLIRRACFA